jgi:hypothetical protein
MYLGITSNFNVCWERLTKNLRADLRESWYMCVQEETMYVFIWAGKDVEESTMHPPFNLSLRLLLELTPHIAFLTGSDMDFDPEMKPFATGAGHTERYSVQRHAAANTTVAV